MRNIEVSKMVTFSKYMVSRDEHRFHSMDLQSWGQLSFRFNFLYREIALTFDLCV